jgi:uncharacterized protein YrrD
VLNKAKTLKGYKLNSLDGEIGKVKEFYFDDQHWTIRYLVADTGSWLQDRQVLISPYAMIAVNKEEENININLTKNQIEGSPPVESDKPVSRQFEETYNGYYGWPAYWGAACMGAVYPNIEIDSLKLKEDPQVDEDWNPNLRSTYDVTGHDIQAIDGEIGHIKDFIIDDETMTIRYLIIDTGNWWPGKKVLISPKWIERVSGVESKVFVNLLRETIKKSPEYIDESLLNRDYEIGLHKHYDRQGYWVD